jgi:hypothetical protein
MIWHTVWFKLKEDVTDEQRQEMLDALDALPSQIEEISTLACGEDFCGRSKGFQIGLVTSFASRADLEAYATHPFHQNFIARYKPLWEEVVALDFDA